MLSLISCTSLSTDSDFDNPDYQQVLRQLDSWSLRGRLNIRSSNSNDTVNINWQQNREAFDINLSGTLGLGAVRISGDDQGVLIEKAGEESFRAPSLEVVGSEILGYVFPAGELLYWIRGLPAPGPRPGITYNPDGLIATLSQQDYTGRRWELQYDRYADIDGHYLPGRLRLEQAPYRLTFLIAKWEIPDGTDQ